METRFIDVKQLSEYLNTPKATIYFWAQKKHVPYTKVGRKLLFDKKIIDEWIVRFSKADQSADSSPA